MTLVSTEAELQRIFGDPTSENYEYWYTVSNFLEYGGVCYVIRCDDSVGDSSGTFLQTMKNATDEVVGPTTKYSLRTTKTSKRTGSKLLCPWTFRCSTPGTWGNGLAVAVIDHGADFQISLKNTEIVTGFHRCFCNRRNRLRYRWLLVTLLLSTSRSRLLPELQPLSAGDKVVAYNGSGSPSANAVLVSSLTLTPTYIRFFFCPVLSPLATPCLTTPVLVRPLVSATYTQATHKLYKDANVTHRINTILVP